LGRGRQSCASLSYTVPSPYGGSHTRSAVHAKLRSSTLNASWERLQFDRGAGVTLSGEPAASLRRTSR
jgi:hypothetical protein